MVAAGIVTYNPDIKKLKENYIKYLKDVDKLYIFDNGSNNYDEIRRLFDTERKVLLIEGKKNYGIAYGLNVIMNSAQNDGIDWVLTMDQDSICQDNILHELMPFCKKKIGIIHPRVFEKGGTRGCDKREKLIENIDFCITAGSLTNVEAWNNSGKFDEWMFIDIVDFEFCAKLRECGYKIIQVNNATLTQEVGKLKEIIIGKRHIYVRNHLAIRKYYYARNLIYCYHKHPKTFPFKIMINCLISTYVKVFLFEQDKLTKIKSMNKGIIDAGKKIALIKRQAVKQL